MKVQVLFLFTASAIGYISWTN